MHRTTGYVAQLVLNLGVHHSSAGRNALQRIGHLIVNCMTFCEEKLLWLILTIPQQTLKPEALPIPMAVQLKSQGKRELLQLMQIERTLLATDGDSLRFLVAHLLIAL